MPRKKANKPKAKPKARKQGLRALNAKERDCAHCGGSIIEAERTIEIFCDACRLAALRILWHFVSIVPLAGSLHAVVARNRFVGAIATNVEGQPFVSLSNWLVAKALRQGRMIEGKTK